MKRVPTQFCRWEEVTSCIRTTSIIWGCSITTTWAFRTPTVHICDRTLTGMDCIPHHCYIRSNCNWATWAHGIRWTMDNTTCRSIRTTRSTICNSTKAATHGTITTTHSSSSNNNSSSTDTITIRRDREVEEEQPLVPVNNSSSNSPPLRPPSPQYRCLRQHTTRPSRRRPPRQTVRTTSTTSPRRL